MGVHLAGDQVVVPPHHRAGHLERDALLPSLSKAAITHAHDQVQVAGGVGGSLDKRAEQDGTVQPAAGVDVLDQRCERRQLPKGTARAACWSGHAAASCCCRSCSPRSTSLPRSNLAPARTSATRCGPLTARQRPSAASSSLNTIASPASLLPGPLVTLVLARTGEKVDSMGLVVRRCSQCSAGSSKKVSKASRSSVILATALGHLAP